MGEGDRESHESMFGYVECVGEKMDGECIYLLGMNGKEGIHFLY